MKNEFQMMTQQSTQILFHMYKTEQYLLKENPQKYLENYSQQISKVICQSAKYIDIQAIDQLLEDIHQHKKIYLYGYSFGKNLALTMQDNFLHLGKLCICPDTYEIQEKTIETITSQDLVIVISVYAVSYTHLTCFIIHLIINISFTILKLYILSTLSIKR